MVASAAFVVAIGTCCPGVAADGAKPRPDPQSDAADIHKVSVQFDYDFSKHPSCSDKPAEKTCIKQFDVYDVSGQKFRLFTIPVPKGATGMVKGISGTSPSRAFLPGAHFISVTAEDSQGVESATSAARVRVEIKAKTADNSSGDQK